MQRDLIDKEIRELRGRTATYIGGAFGLVAGLAWNEAITSFINYVFPLEKNTLLIKFLYAIAVTIVVVILVSYLEKKLRGPETINPKP
jgi:hypothetical protein